MSGAIKIGVVGWSYKDWKGIAYPENPNPKSRVEYLAAYFNLIEINTLFYGHIKPAVAFISAKECFGERRRLRLSYLPVMTSL